MKQYVTLSKQSTLLALVIDEISIRKHIQWDGKKFHGYVSYGIDLEDDNNAVCKEAFVLLAVCINARWKLPLGYFFTDGLSGEQKSTLVSQCVNLVIETGAEIVSLTFDGAPSNVAMCKHLGCIPDASQLKTDFIVNGNKMFAFLDPCHMVKLVRNTLGEKKCL